MQATKDVHGHGLFMFLQTMMGAALLQVPADLISFVGRLLEVELWAVSLCPWHRSIQVPPGALSTVPDPGHVVVVLFLGESLAAGLTFSLVQFCLMLCPLLSHACCVLAGLNSGFLLPPSSPHSG